ncbi:MAG: hypothetical protein M1133_04505 [Armatimonadetes bacterium]|nr:hypothetical protein [Armatimonadota bacterium]
MVRTVNVSAQITADHELHIKLPDDVPVGPASVVVVVTTQAEPGSQTLGDLAQSEFFGMWKDRTDIDDSFDFARKVREEAWRRSA